LNACATARILSTLRASPVKKNSVPPWKLWLPIIAIVAAVIAAFWPVFSAGFIWDDDTMLTTNPLMHGLLRTIWFSSEPIDYFPLTYTSLWLEWRMWGMNALGYHVTNVLLHAASCVILWRVFERLKFPAAWLAALLFAVHPVNVESVAWIAERKNVLAMFFYALTALWFVAFAQTGKNRFYAFSIVAFLLSLLAKPAAVAWPIIAFGILWFFSNTQSTAPVSERFKKNILRVLPFVALSLGASIVTVWFQNHRAIGNDVIHHHDWPTRLATAGGTIWFYLTKAVVPFPLSFVYPMWHIDAHSLTAYVPWIVLCIVTSVLWNFRKTWGKALLMALAYFILLLAPVLGFLNVYFQRYAYVADHWQYFALPAITVLLAAAMYKLRAQYLGIALVLVFGAMTFAQCRVYHNEDTLWADTLKKNPNCWLAINNIAFRKQQAGLIDEAYQLHKKSIAIEPIQPEAHNNLGNLLLNAGKLDDALVEIRESIRVDPHYAPAYYNLATIYQQQGKLDEAIAAYRQAVRWNENYAAAYNNLGCLLEMRGRPEEGLVMVRRALALAPDYAGAAVNCGAILNETGRPQEARMWLEKGIALDPKNADAHLNFGNSLAALNQDAAAQEQFMAALQLAPGHYLAQYGLANCLLRAGQKEAARDLYKKVLARNPKHAQSHYQLALICIANKQERQEGLEHLREAIRLKPQWVEALNNLAWALATDSNCPPANRGEAVRFAQQAVELTHAADSRSLDTLAVAWARNEVFSRAIEAGERALALATQSRETNFVSELQQRLVLYKVQKSYSELSN
jgi:tetratricopeptide (TPR) repeat protein